VHEAVRQVTIGRQQQQPRGAEIQSADIDPSTLRGSRQAVEDRLTPLGITLAGDLPGRLVVSDRGVYGSSALCVKLDGTPVDRDRLATFEVISELRRTPIDRDAAGRDPPLDLSA
jgi:hypothetical protein